MNYFKFNPNTSVPEEAIFSNKIVNALVEYEHGNAKTLRDLHLVPLKPYYQIGGYQIDLKPYFNLYWVKDSDHIFECYALNKADIRKTYSGVLKIIEVK